MNRTTIAVAAALAAGLIAGATGEHLLAAPAAQPGGPTRTVLQRAEVQGVPGKEIVLSMSEFAPGAASGLHLHPGGELAYVAEGAVATEEADKPPVTNKMGMSLLQPARVPHVARNASTIATAKVIACTVVDKGQPNAVPVP